MVSCFLAGADRGAWRGWAELSITTATVTGAPAAGWQSAAADKACPSHYLLPDDYVYSMWYKALGRLSLSMTLNCNYSRAFSADHQAADFLCFLLQPTSPPHLCGQPTHSVLSGVSTCHATTSVTMSYRTYTSTSTSTSMGPDRDSAWRI